MINLAIKLTAKKFVFKRYPLILIIKFLLTIHSSTRELRQNKNFLFLEPYSYMTGGMF